MLSNFVNFITRKFASRCVRQPMGGSANYGTGEENPESTKINDMSGAVLDQILGPDFDLLPIDSKIDVLEVVNQTNYYIKLNLVDLAKTR